MKHSETPSINIGEKISLGQDNLTFFAGPCAMESEKLVLNTAEFLADLAMDHDISIVFKSSFDKANRTSMDSHRSIGISQGLKLLERVKSQFGLPVTTDVHETHQMSEVAEIVDVIQIPAFLSRQTDLLIAAGATGKPVNIKKGQFLSPEDMYFAKQKANQFQRAFVTERGSFFGYGDQVVDFRGLPKMRKFSKVVYDVTHSIQRPNKLNGSSGGDGWLAPHLARAAVAVGVDGLFLETHPNPEVALSDGPNMIPLADVNTLILELQSLNSLFTKGADNPGLTEN